MLDSDESLLSPYLAFLSALAKADNSELNVNGATAVYRLLSDDITAVGSSTSPLRMTWRQIFELLRYYARELSSQNYGAESPSSTSASAGGNTPTSYYYSSSTNSAAQQAKANTSSKPKELGETNNFYLQSLLFLVSNVAKKSPSSRLDLLSIKLPIAGAESPAGYDVTLNVMFTLVTAHLPPEVRGAVFTAIASLLNTESCNKVDSAKIKEMAVEGWKLVDSCQILPIYLLDQYPRALDGNTRVGLGLRFPPSSTSLVSFVVGASVLLRQVVSFLTNMSHIFTTGWQWIKEFVVSCRSGLRYTLRNGTCGISPGLLPFHRRVLRIAGFTVRLGGLSFRSRGEYTISKRLQPLHGICHSLCFAKSHRLFRQDTENAISHVAGPE